MCGNEQGNVNMLKVTLAIITVLGLAACETTEGFGRDVQKAGQAIEDEAD
jgi:entericidin B